LAVLDRIILRPKCQKPHIRRAAGQEGYGLKDIAIPVTSIAARLKPTRKGLALVWNRRELIYWHRIIHDYQPTIVKDFQRIQHVP
jgi:hypothetical protein